MKAPALWGVATVAAAIVWAVAPARAATFDLFQTFDEEPPRNRGNFGSSVAVDDGRVLVGTSRQFGSEVHLFDATTGELLQTFGGSGFGNDVALDGNNVLVNGAAGSDIGSLYSAATGELLHAFADPTANQTGTSLVALDGTNAIVGVPSSHQFAGEVHLFDTQTGALMTTFANPDINTQRRFGSAVDIDADKVVIGAVTIEALTTPITLGYGQVNLFSATTGALLRTFVDPEQSATTGLWFGASRNSVAIDGSNVLIGSSGANKAYLFDASSGDLLQTFSDPTPSSNDSQNDFDLFGASVAINGNNILIGAPQDTTHTTDGTFVGQVHLFDATTGALLQTFDDPTVTSGDVFGRSVAIDGAHVVIGSPGDDTSAPLSTAAFPQDFGQAHLYSCADGAGACGAEPAPALPDTPAQQLAPGGEGVLLGVAFADAPAIVVTHGWQPGLDPPDDWELGPVRVSEAVLDLVDYPDFAVEPISILSYAWPGAYQPDPLIWGDALAKTGLEGHKLALDLHDLGVTSVHLIGHSYGTWVNAFAAAELEMLGVEVQQFTILDRPFGQGIFWFGSDLSQDEQDMFSAKLANVSTIDNYYGVPFLATGAPLAGAHNQPVGRTHFGVDDYYYDSVSSAESDEFDFSVYSIHNFSISADDFAERLDMVIDIP